MVETFSQPQIAGFPSSARLMTLSVHAGEVFANREKALHWLQSPNPSLEGKTPLESAQTEQGHQAVEDILGRIEYGVLG
jgi:putative toxin-antitoxin system antitoxin component (TIGR02293 family)